MSTDGAEVVSAAVGTEGRQMQKGEQLRITELEGEIVTVESDGVLRSFTLEAADDGHREHGGLGPGQMLTVREDAEIDDPVAVDVWGCGCQFALVPRPPV